MDTALPHKFLFILDRNLAKANCTENHVCTSCDKVVLDPAVIFSSHTMFINASTKEFTLVNNALQSYDIAFEEILYYRLAPPIL